jgi:hypothetical protein
MARAALLLLLGASAHTSPAEALQAFVPAPGVWRTPPIRPEGFQFEIQISSLGAAYDRARVEASIQAHDLGEFDSAVSKVIAAEWGYSFTHLDGQVDGAGRKIQAGYPEPPRDRAECLPVLEAFLHRQYIMGRPRPWASMNGHYPWHHYAAEFGFDQIGSEIGENINNYQWHMALNRGAARQFRRPWFVDFSAWHGPSITDYSTPGIWGEHSGPDHGHSMSLFARSLYVAYLSGAGQITAEAGGAIAFLPDAKADGPYALSPYGMVCKEFRDFTRACPDVGIPVTPFGLLLDRHHGAYPGFGARRAFHHFDYGPGDDMLWRLVDRIWPGGWEVMGRDETGTLVNGPYGDTFDAILQHAPQAVLDSYPALLPVGALRWTPEEVGRLRHYVRQGGTLLLNTAYQDQLPWLPPGPAAQRYEGKGQVWIYGPDHAIDALDPWLRQLLATHLPVRVDGGVQFLVNVRPQGPLVTLINNDGVTKAPREPARVDPARARTATLTWIGEGTLRGALELRAQTPCMLEDARTIRVRLPAGEIAVIALDVERPDGP